MGGLAWLDAYGLSEASSGLAGASVTAMRVSA